MSQAKSLAQVAYEAFQQGPGAWETLPVNARATWARVASAVAQRVELETVRRVLEEQKRQIEKGERDW